ncbi:unnamed protein product [Camellia sinensis]
MLTQPLTQPTLTHSLRRTHPHRRPNTGSDPLLTSLSELMVVVAMLLGVSVSSPPSTSTSGSGASGSAYENQQQSQRSWWKSMFSSFVVNPVGSSVVLPIYGNVYPHGFYHVQLNIGQPSKPYFLDPDTGSDLTWLQCDAPCVHCTKALGQASPDISAFIRAKTAAYPIFEMIERNTISKTSLKTSRKLVNHEGHIQFKDVCFSYPSRPDVMIFNKLCLDIPSGKIVALVGGRL